MRGTSFLVDYSVFKDALLNYDFYVHLSICVSGFVDFFFPVVRSLSSFTGTCAQIHFSFSLKKTTCDKKSCCCSLAEVMRRSGLPFVVAWTIPFTTRGPGRVSEG